MLIQIPDVLTAEQVAHARRILDAAEWVDGRVTAGHQSAQAKDNVQVPEGHPAAREVGETIMRALQQQPLFISAALPLHVFPPLFNRYSGGQSFGNQARRRFDGVVPVDQPASCPAGHPRRARLVVLLAAEHGAR